MQWAGRSCSVRKPVKENKATLREEYSRQLLAWEKRIFESLLLRVAFGVKQVH